MKKPNLSESWEKTLKEVAKYDDDMVKNWKEDIDTLLVFAGLFSAVVTAFTIESYQWLEDDPADTTVTFLARIIAIQLNVSQSSAEVVPTQFEPDSSSIRINCFWFLSLILSLTSALFGLLCKQWLREHQRDTPTRTPGEALALRQLRRDSLEKWGVSSFISALPILLELALLLFFVGVLDLLWTRHPIPFALCFIAVVFSAGLYFVTTFLPILMAPEEQNMWWFFDFTKDLSYQFVCPYKSPQAWVIYRLSCKVMHPFLNFRLLNNLLFKRARGLWDHIRSPASDWSSFDLHVVRQFDKSAFVFLEGDPFHLKVYELRALQWTVNILRDSPAMIPHLHNLLETIPPSVAMSAVFDEWDVTMWEDVSASDVELRLQGREKLRYSRPQYMWWVPAPSIRHPSLHHPEGIKLLFCHQYWIAQAPRATVYFNVIDSLIDSMEKADLKQSTGLHFVIPFSVVDALWAHENAAVRKQSLRLLRLFKESWKSPPEHNKYPHGHEQLAFVVALTRHLKRADRTSELMISKRGQTFLRFVDKEITLRGLLCPQYWDKADLRLLISEWKLVMRRVQQVGGLPSNYFQHIASEDPLAANRLLVVSDTAQTT
ncbi:hypothetical protein Moror_14970 [Moniliophthora roreri MCA 2997]|uniref:DUF6535 domain-containing protein n=1 Tax=Moniliophthora roreri (strain MCA 2997) TaxID=1381753 RepID=V2WXA1_MONRO|nr:hypothetical protein Moror_14970 [Moniliophthora roreri MCA 2997]